MMNNRDFTAFTALFEQVHEIAFGSKFEPLNYQKAQGLSWMIFEKTEVLISYKSLINYSKAIATHDSDSINPNLSTLVTLLHFTGYDADHIQPCMAWIRYCSEQPTVAKRSSYSDYY
jgi:hypothetical protein